MKFFGFLFFIAFYFLAANSAYCLQDLPRYDISCEINTQSRSLQAKQKVSFFNNQDTALDEIYFHIYPNRKFTEREKELLLRYAGYFKVSLFPEGFQTPEFKLKKITSGKKILDYEIEGEDSTILKVKLAEPLNPGERVQLEIDFSLSLPHCYGRLGWHNSIFSLSRWYPLLSVLDEEGWHNYPFYLFHQPYFSEASFYRLELTLPKDQIVAHTGSLKEKFQNPDGTKTLIIETDMPVRDFSFSFSHEYKTYSLSLKDIKINSFYLPGDEFYAKKAAEYSSDLIRYYSENFGPYPYKEFSIAPVYLGYGGEESSNTIFIDTRVYKLPKFLIRYFDFLVSHETGHQWWYNLVGSDGFREAWLDEGINSYCLLRHLENKYGKDAEVLVLPEALKPLIPNFSFRKAAVQRYLYLVKNGLDRPILGPLSGFREPSSIFALAYGKGEAVMAMLEALVGDEVFFKIMQEYFDEFKYENAKVEDFQKICEEVSGLELDDFFSDWLKSSKFCDYAVGKVGKDAVIIENRGSIEMPVETRIIFKDGEGLTDYWDGKGKTHKLALKGKEIKSIQIDPQGKLLDIERTNNSYPASIEIMPVPFYFFAYEVPVFLSDKDLSLVLGPAFEKYGAGIKASLQKPHDYISYLSFDYDFNAQKIISRFGYQINHLFNKQVAFGFQAFDHQGDEDKDDLEGLKVYCRKELWPFPYSISEVNDHLTLYFLHNREYEPTTTSEGKEDIEHLHYRKKDESIFGISAQVSHYGPYPDAEFGFRLIPTLEFAGHILGGTEDFLRGQIEWDRYIALGKKRKAALRIKIGRGSPSDKVLFQLGGDEGLRGYERKTINGSSFLLSSLEYRFPLYEDLRLFLFDNILHFEGLQGVVFFDIGKAWYSSYSAPSFKKDAGLGLRFYANLGAFLEKIAFRLDWARAIDEPEEDAHLWFGVSQAF